jgi:hypothetical protein
LITMLKSVTVEEIDQLLDELERLLDEASLRKFLLTLLERLRFVLKAASVAYAVPTIDGQWLTMAASGQSDRYGSPDTEGTGSYWAGPDFRHVAVPLRRRGDQADWRRGAVVVEFAHPPTESEIDALVKLCEAFVEVLALRQTRDLDAFIDESWPGVERSMSGLAEATSTRAAAFVLTNDLAVLASADRVSLVHDGLHGPHPLAISGVAEFKQNAESVLTMLSLCRQALKSGQAMVRREDKHQSEPQPAGILGNFLVLPIVVRHRGQSECRTALLLEWSDYDRFLTGSTILQLIFPSLCSVWLQHQRWLNMPAVVRSWYGRSARIRHSRALSMIAKSAAIALVVAVAGWLLTFPTTLRIEANGTLQPIEQRIVFAPLDGLVASIAVRDGQLVQQGELLAVLQSPMLEISLEEVAGEQRANQEKLAGLKVAINQLSPDVPSALAMQNRFSSEIREIETRLATLEEKQRALMGEKARLQVVAPIAGTIIARQVDRYLERRPVRRGDPLLRIVEIDGPWRLELEVADRDAGRVKEKLFSGTEMTSGEVRNASAAGVEFVYAASPDKRWQATATWMSESARNPYGENVIVDVHASVPAEAVAEGHMGATVQAYFDCGRQPFWFVWSRPLVEAIQRKLWF